ncbi:hypothetical protein MXB_1794, partial [Myxobolus squamalis]
MVQREKFLKRILEQIIESEEKYCSGVVEGFLTVSQTLIAIVNYAKNYLDSRFLFTKLYENDNKFRSFIEFQESAYNTKEDHRFCYYRRLPIDRIYRYKAFFACLFLNSIKIEQKNMICEINEIIERLIRIIEKDMRYCDSFDRMCKLQRTLNKSSKFDGRQSCHFAKGIHVCGSFACIKVELLHYNRSFTGDQFISFSFTVCSKQMKCSSSWSPSLKSS